MARDGTLSALRGAPNFRDLGGRAAQDGRRVQHGLVFRSGQIGELHPEDVALLRTRLGEDVCVVDLRGTIEREKRVCALQGATVHSLPIEPAVGQKLIALEERGEAMTPAVARRFMCEAYESFARDARPQLTAFLDHALARQSRPLVVHCTAGKDRTGFMIAMLLGALGVPRAGIIEDYLLTNGRVTPRASTRFPPDIMEVLVSAREEFLAAAFTLIEREFNGLDAYLENAAGLGPERRDRLCAQLLR